MLRSGHHFPPSMPLQQHVYVSPPRIFPSYFIKGRLDFFYCYYFSCFCCLFKRGQYRFLFRVCQRPMMGLVLVPYEFFQPLFPILSAYLADPFFPRPIYFCYIRYFIPFSASLTASYSSLLIWNRLISHHPFQYTILFPLC